MKPTTKSSHVDAGFLDCTAVPQRFFGILPDDWRAELEPVWGRYATTAGVYVLKSERAIVAGGIVFRTVSPDTESYRDIAQSWLDRDFLYLGYLWVPVPRRGNGWGSLWVRELRSAFPGRNFWLTVDEPGLRTFYESNGFLDHGKVPSDQVHEWILADPV